MSKLNVINHINNEEYYYRITSIKRPGRLLNFSDFRRGVY